MQNLMLRLTPTTTTTTFVCGLSSRTRQKKKNAQARSPETWVHNIILDGRGSRREKTNGNNDTITNVVIWTTQAGKKDTIWK